MRYTLVIFLLFFLFCHAGLSQTPSVSENFIMETVVRVSGVTSMSQLEGLPGSFREPYRSLFRWSLRRPIMITTD